jgi:predicted hotdog family 3-hydroxylacyl-ACP dehydratase
VIRAPLDRSWLTAHLPHQGRMNLLDEIVAWDATSLRALARNHHAGDHPLRRAGVLPAACGIEYGAQAAAAHGALAGTQNFAPGFLASVRSVVFHADRLDDVAGDLEITTEQIAASAAAVLYRFEVGCGGRALVEGRLTVAFAR